jgi:hypothetical protein
VRWGLLRTVFAGLLLADPAAAGLLDPVHATGRTTVGVRSDAAPFSHLVEEGLRRPASGERDARFGEDAIPLDHRLRSPAREPPRLSDPGLSVELCGLPVAEADDAFGLPVGRGLARLYRTGEIRRIFVASFEGAEPGPLAERLRRRSVLSE